MSWFKLAQPKPLPLPVENANFNSGGTLSIDETMTEPTAKRERRKRPASYLGAGSSGLAVDLGDDKAAKYTTQQREAEMAEHFKSSPCPCVANIHHVEQIQHDPRLWVIVMDKLREANKEEQQIIYYMSCQQDSSLESIHEYAKKMKRSYPEHVSFIDKCEEFLTCIKECNVGDYDYGGNNIAFDKNNNLRLFDLGGSYLTPHV